MQWMILVIPVQVVIVVAFALGSIALAIWATSPLWTRKRRQARPCCVCGAAHGQAVCYRDELGFLVKEQFCSVCLGQLLSPVEDTSGSLL